LGLFLFSNLQSSRIGNAHSAPVSIPVGIVSANHRAKCLREEYLDAHTNVPNGASSPIRAARQMNRDVGGHVDCSAWVRPFRKPYHVSISAYARADGPILMKAVVKTSGVKIGPMIMTHHGLGYGCPVKIGMMPNNKSVPTTGGSTTPVSTDKILNIHRFVMSSCPTPVRTGGAKRRTVPPVGAFCFTALLRCRRPADKLNAIAAAVLAPRTQRFALLWSRPALGPGSRGEGAPAPETCSPRPPDSGTPTFCGSCV